MRIAFYFDDQYLAPADYSQPQRGNPGIGGTQYCFLLLMYYLRPIKSICQLTVYHYSDALFPTGVSCVKIRNFNQCLQLAESANHDFLIMAQNTGRDVWKAIESSSQRVIFWGHNFYYYDLCRWISTTPQVVANVFVGKQLYDYYADDAINRKSTCIFNIITDPLGECIRHNDSKTVVYMGALIPVKGFHLLAHMWKSILQEVPEAKLKVLGSGKMYNSNLPLGKLGIAEKSYEKSFLPFLTDKQGKLLDSVEFLGILNKEKYDIFLNASVGVVNPSARTETFGMGIVEMAAAKLPCVTLKKKGHIDTILNHQTGFLCTSQQEIKNKIIYLLKHPDQNECLGECAKKNIQRFFPDIIIPQWIQLFERLQSGITKQPYSGASKPYWLSPKWFVVVNRFLKFSCRLNFLPSCIQWEYMLRKLLSNLLRK